MKKNDLPAGVSALNFMTSEELTDAEKEDLPEGNLIRETGDGMVYMKVVDIWTPYQMERLRQPPQPLTKYGRMRRKYLEEWKVRPALELGENLLIHCWEIQEQAKAMKSELMAQLESQNPPPPDRGSDPLGWG